MHYLLNKFSICSFYRKDILSELGLNIPRTWEDVMEVIPELQKRNMNFGLPLSALAIRRASGQGQPVL